MTRLLPLCLVLCGCSRPPTPMERFDPPPFAVGDVVRLRGAETGDWWTVERVVGSRVHVVREPHLNRVWNSPLAGATQRETYDAALLVRRVQWMSNEPEPLRRAE